MHRTSPTGGFTMNDPDSLPGEGLPLINGMGVNEAATKGILNTWVKQQLTHVHSEAASYVPMAPRGFGDDNQMPHEWGSMDSYDDMRNSMRAGIMLMDPLLDPFDQVDPRSYIEWHQNLIVEVVYECGLCSLDIDLKLAWPDTDEEKIHDLIYEAMEKRS
jgi:hypothetical protein